MTIVATSRKREKFASSLTRLSNFQELGMVDFRRSKRIVPARVMTAITMNGGSSVAVMIEDLSATGARIKTSDNLSVGSEVSIGSRRAHVLRQTEDGYALEFSTPIDAQDLNAGLAQQL